VVAVQAKRVPRAEARVGPADAKAYELAAGEYVQIEDLQGCQVSDFLAFHRDRPGLGISTTVTRALVDGLFPLPGQGIYDGEGGKLLTLVEDTVGRHDTFGIACNREYYESLGHPDHINCTDNFNRELAAFGYEPRRFWEPINFFYNTKIGADGRVIDI
jgi:aminomethyltransferase